MRAVVMCRPISFLCGSPVFAPYLHVLVNRQLSINAKSYHDNIPSIPFSRTPLWRNSCSHNALKLSSNAVAATDHGNRPTVWNLQRQFSLSAAQGNCVFQWQPPYVAGLQKKEQSETVALARSIRSRVGLLWAKVKAGFRFIKYSKKNLKQAGLVMYSCCTDPLNHLHFFDVLGMPDTFNSWFKVTELHVWMCAVRLSLEAYDGKYVRNEIVRNMWLDVDARSQRLGEAAMLMRKKQIKELSHQFRANLFAYDEGLLCNDKVLAGAIWRNFFAMNCDDPRKVELLVHYVRKQIDNLDTQDRYNILGRGIVKWIPINEVKDADQRIG